MDLSYIYMITQSTDSQNVTVTHILSCYVNNIID